MTGLKASEALKLFAIGGLPEGYGHIFDFVTARKTGRQASPEVERVIVEALDAMLVAASSKYPQISAPDWQKINYSLLMRESVPLEKPSTAKALAAFAKALGLNKTRGATKKPLHNFNLALDVARLVVSGMKPTPAIQSVASKQPGSRHVDKTQTVERAWKKFKDLAEPMAESEKRSCDLQEQLKNDPSQVGRVIGQIANDLGGGLLGLVSRVKN